MKRLLSSIASIMLVFAFTGCFDSGSNTANRLTFENSSTYRVHIIPLTTEWGGLHLDPGETVRLDDVKDVDYRYEPSTRVMEGSRSEERHVVFVNIK